MILNEKYWAETKSRLNELLTKSIEKWLTEEEKLELEKILILCEKFDV